MHLDLTSACFRIFYANSLMGIRIMTNKGKMV